MNNKILHKAETYRKTHRKKQWLYRGLSVLAAGAVFCTTYALILPAITMEKEPTCGFTEHEHSAACFSENQVIGTYSCLSDLHVHEDGCFDSDGNIICGYADFVVHSHGEFCFNENGDLICELPEILVHTHNEDCFAAPEEAETHEHTENCFTLQKGELLCDTEEYAGHTHEDICVGINSKTLICTVEESEGHVHTEACEGIVSEMLSCELEESEGHSHSGECYQTVQTENLICGSEEYDGHVHDETCIGENGELICETEETEGHSHSGECYELTQELVCELSESEGHAHDDNCYTVETGNICGLEESEGHIHNDDCYEIQTGYICGHEEAEGHIHNDECYEWTEELICAIESNEKPAEEDTELEAVCGYDEIILHEHDEIECFDAEGNLICGQIQVLEHIHSESCIEESEPELVCELKEHIHDEILCYIDSEADIENADVWEATLPEELSGSWAADLIAVAQSQLDYTESETNVLVGANGEVSHYSRYGAWFGRPYAEWNQIFLSFCLNYAGIPEEAIPQTDDTENFISTASEMGILQDGEYTAQVGDIAVLCDEYGVNTVGIITDFAADENDVPVPMLISGDINGEVVWYESVSGNINNYISVAKAYDLYQNLTSGNMTEDDIESEQDEADLSDDEVCRDISINITGEEVNGEILVTLEAVFEGIDPASYLWQWQTSNDGVNDWIDIADATDVVYIFCGTKESMACYYRICGIKPDDVLAVEPIAMFSLGFEENETSEEENAEEDQSYIISNAVTPISDPFINQKAFTSPDDGNYYIYFYDFERNGSRIIAYTSDGIEAGKTGVSYNNIVAPDGLRWDGNWYLDAECTRKYDFNTPVSNMTDDLTGTYDRDLYLYPGAEEIWNIVFISYGSYVTPLQLLRTETFNIDADDYIPTRTGYTFDGWYLDEELTESNKATAEQGCPVNIAESNYTVYYYAKWGAGYVPFNAMLRTENANDTNFTQAEGLGTWYALAGSTIKVNTSGTTHEVVCVINGEEHPVYTSDPGNIDNTNEASQATLDDVYNDYFVFNNSTSDEWTEVFGESQLPYTTRPISSSTDNPTVINFDYMRVRVDVTFNISNGNNGGYIDIYKLVQNGTLTGTVNYSGTVPTSTGQNVSASGVTADDGIAWEYTAANNNQGTNTYVLKDVKYGQRFADAYPVGTSWLTNKNTSYQYKSYSVSGSNTPQASVLLDLAANYMRNSGRSSSAATFTANFANNKTIGLMYAFECIDNEVADFTINGTSYKVNPEYCEIMNYNTNSWGAKDIPGYENAGRQAWGVNRDGSQYTGYTYSLSYTDSENSQEITNTIATTLYTVTYWDYYSSSVSGLEDFYSSNNSYRNDLYIFYYDRERINVAFDFNYDNDNDSQNEIVTYTDLLYGQSLTSYQYAMPDGAHHNLLTRDGYRFLGWMDDKGEVYSDENWEDMKLIGSEGSTMTFYAKWEQLSTNIVQYYETASSTEPFEWHFFSDGSTVPYPEMVVYPDGWVWTNRQVGSQQTFDWNVPMYGSYGVTEELTIDGETKSYNVIKIYGTWNNTAVKVGYDANVKDGGIQANAPVDSESYELGYTKVPVKALGNGDNTLGKVFVGWKLDKNGLVYQPGDHVSALWMPYMTFIAQWADQTDVVKLIYDPNGGTPANQYNSDNNYARGAVTTVWNNMTSVNDVETDYYTRDGYEFIGWNTSADGSGTEYAPGTQITLTDNETILYAQWRPTNYTLTIEKYYNASNDSSKTMLAGAEFNLYSIDGTTETLIGDTLTSGTEGTVTVSAKLQIGTLYKLVETKAPDGFILLTDPIYFRLTTDGELEFCDENGNSIQNVYASGVFDGSDPADRQVTISVMNKAGYELPETGGIGTFPYTLGGLMIVGASAILFMYKTRRRQRG